VDPASGRPARLGAVAPAVKWAIVQKGSNQPQQRTERRYGLPK
jgi:hypothetical protein